MRTFVLSMTICAVVALFAAPASAQTVTTVLGLTNAGTVTTCPAVAKFGGVINVAKWPSGPRQLQYKWTFSDAGDQPTQSVTAQAGLDITVTPVNVSLGPLNKTSSGWVQLTVTYPANYVAAKINWVLVCPTPGSLGTGLPSGPTLNAPGGMGSGGTGNGG
jgi:hypothetical protein